MALLRGFAQIEKEGRIQLPHNVCVHLGLSGKKVVQVDAVSTRGGKRRPRLIVHPAEYSSRISPLDSVMVSGAACVDNRGAIIPEAEILRLVGFSPGDHLEMKVQGTEGQPCLVVYHRSSPARVSERGKTRHRGRSIKVMKWRY
jgi:bifunctional DNA-binding transcriptional regulator/antitoxin component of YhaV-PrlF toxin-antitoxin module